MSKITTVLFDFDGTIMDTNDVIIQSWQHTFRTFLGKESPIETLYATFGEPLGITVERFFPDHNTEEVMDVYRNYQAEYYKDIIELFPGVKELIIGLKAKNYKVALVTSRMKDTTDIGIEKFGLAPYLDCIVTADDTTKHKPDPDPILVAMKKLNVTPEETIMVGDSKFDILCAHNAGVKAVLVGWNLAVNTQVDMESKEPDFIMETAEDLYKCL